MHLHDVFHFINAYLAQTRDLLILRNGGFEIKTYELNRSSGAHTTPQLSINILLFREIWIQWILAIQIHQ